MPTPPGGGRDTPPDAPLILLVTSGYHLYREYLVRMVAGAARVWLLCDAPPAWEEPYLAGHTVVDTGDPAALIAAAGEVDRRAPVSGVLCWDEVKMMHTARVARALGLPGGDPAAVRRCRDKHRTRRALAAAAVAQPASVVVSDHQGARAAAERIGYPVIVKPRALGASLGVALVRDPGELAAGFARARTAREDGVPYFRGGVLVEEYLDGPEISIDCAVHDGEVMPMFLARKATGFPPYFEEVGHSVDAADPLLDDARLRGLLRRAHQAVGYRDGITHTEVRLTACGPKIVEINARLGGDLIPLVGFLATGIDPGRVAVDVACGIRPDVAPSSAGVAAVRFMYPERDAVAAGVSIDRAALPPSVLVARALALPGQELLLPPRGNVTGRYGYAIAAAATAEECAAALDGAGRAMRLDVAVRHTAAPDARAAA